LYEPGLNNSAYRWLPNWLLSCWLNTLSTVFWIEAADIDGSKTWTFGPRSGVPGGGVGAPKLNDCAADPLQVYCWSWTESAVEAAGTSRHLPLKRLTKW
jgi:hypothetical protein